MKKRLSARAIETLKPPPTGRLEITDSDSGAVFRITSKGARSWSVLFTLHGKQQRRTLGSYPAVGLAEARELARETRHLAVQGVDPRPVEEPAAPVMRVADAISLYAKIYLAPNLRTAAERERQLRAALAPHLARPIDDLDRVDLQAAIDAKAAEGRLGAANRIRAALVHFSRWCFERGHLPEHIGAGTARAAKEKPRERVLSLDEIRQVYGATFELGPIWGALFRLRVLTAQRLGDLALAHWSEIDFAARRYEIPGARTKNGRPHIVHLSAPVLAELEALKERTGGTPFVFTTTGKSPVSGFSKANARLYQTTGVEDFRPHDFRTAFASALCEAGESEAVVDRILNHSASGSAPSAVARVYNRAQNLPQRAAALDRWAAMVTGETADVIALPEALVR
ncbi:tyrosine-type recombinase/integrase [Limibaculum sp. M0105]|uniref:Tyrosine-type recombinase/integrase n=1 Tax=Thermohalobaculum xanthum TaxID=2753746 RepID=A0A8J7M4X8_9RHOB|nr:site-specific integrase [Thermohalobaculum xanthum]MBK0398531.1 tyrosine-type recombinase/integrase [Thermohalobaculum xanthum]